PLDSWRSIFEPRIYPSTDAWIIDEQRRLVSHIEGYGNFWLFDRLLREALNVGPRAVSEAEPPPRPPAQTRDDDPVAPLLHLERLFVHEEWEQHEPVRLWRERMDEIVAELTAQALAAAQEPACVGVELAFPG